MLAGIHFDFTKNHREKAFPIGPFQLDLFQSHLITEKITFSDFDGFYPQLNSGFNYRIEELIKEMVKESDERRICFDNCINGLFLTLISIIIRHTIMSKKGFAPRQDNINRLIQFIHDNYKKNFTNEEIGEIFHFHPNYLNQLMKTYTGMSLHQYIIDLRIKKALTLILNTNMTISEISNEVGYENLHYFSRIFKRKA